MKIHHVIFSLVILALAGCGSGGGDLPFVGNIGASTPPPPMGATTVSEPLAFLDQTVCDDGSVDFTRCASKHRQTNDEVARYRRHDLPAPMGYQVGDCVAERCIFSYPPFGRFTVGNGDGGDQYSMSPDGWIRIAVTQDGGKAGILQHFVGPQCGGNGWVLFRQDAPTGSWAEMVARLSNTNDGSCPSSLGRAYTRWRLEDINWTLYFGRQPESVTLPTIVSEHYDRDTIADATALERFYFAKGIGRIRWSAWNKTGIRAEITRCPVVPYDDPPDGSGWALADCRTWTAVEPPEDPTWSAARFDWPPH